MTPPTTPPADLDFASIRQQYPAAFAALIAWFASGKYIPMGTPTADSLSEREAGHGPWLDVGDNLLEIGDFRYEYRLHIRELFDFFDQKGVYVLIGINTSSRIPITFYATLCKEGRLLRESCGDEYPTRTAAESAAFMAAFGKLEDRLKQEQG